jgi:hypothetical protein
VAKKNGKQVTDAPNALPRNNTELSLQKSTGKYSFTHWSISTKPSVEKILARYPIAHKGTRHNVLVQLVGHLSNKFGREAAQRIVEEHYRLNQENIQSTLEEHLREFATAWDGMRKRLEAEFCPEEQRALGEFKTENQREGFLIVRAFAGAAEHKKEKDFPISQASLADRLSMTLPGAGGVIAKLCDVKVIDPTQPCIRHRQSARFRWLLPRGEEMLPPGQEGPPMAGVGGEERRQPCTDLSAPARIDPKCLRRIGARPASLAPQTIGNRRPALYLSQCCRNVVSLSQLVVARSSSSLEALKICAKNLRHDKGREPPGAWVSSNPDRSPLRIKG